MIDRDRINHVCPERAAQIALDVLDRADQGDHEAGLVGLTLALAAVVRRTSAEGNHLLTVADNILNSKHVETPSHQAIQDYVLHELAK